MIRVFVIDDHPLVRVGLTWVLETQKDLRVVGEAGNGMPLRAWMRLSPLARRSDSLLARSILTRSNRGAC